MPENTVSITITKIKKVFNDLVVLFCLTLMRFLNTQSVSINYSSDLPFNDKQFKVLLYFAFKKYNLNN